MKRTAQTHRLASAAFVIAALAPCHLVLAQETTPPPARPDPLATERPVTLPPATSPTVTTPPSTTSTQPSATQPIVPAPLPRATTAPTTATESAQPTATRQATRRTATTRTRADTAASRPAPTTAPATAAPVAAAEPVATPSPAAEAAAPPAALPAPPPADAPSSGNLMWLIGAGLLALLAALAAFALLRRRRARGDAHEEAYEEPVAAPEPVLAAAPVIEPAAEPVPASAFAPAAAIPLADQTVARQESAIEPAHVTVGEVDAADAEAVATGSEPAAGRPWLEFFLRPVRAGIDEEAATVEFDLIVGNTGSEPARDVRVSAFMFSAGSAAESEMERMLIEPPQGEAAELALGAGAAARVEGAAHLPRQSLEGEVVLPVVVADARYRLPDGSEGRMRAAFEVGRADGESLAPFRVDRPSGLTGEVATRLHGEVERV